MEAQNVCAICEKADAHHKHKSITICEACLKKWYKKCGKCGGYHQHTALYDLYMLQDGPLRNIFEGIKVATGDICQQCIDYEVSKYIEKGGSLCSDCGRWTIGCKKIGSHNFCPKCIKELDTCYSCKTMGRRLIKTDRDNIFICNSCHKKKSSQFVNCRVCGRAHRIRRDRVYNNSTFICDKCSLTKAICARCGSLEDTSRGTTIKDGNFFCENCASGGYRLTCDTCGDGLITKRYYNGSYRCVRCTAKSGIAKKEQWNYVPQYFHFHESYKKGYKKDKEQLYLGFENEEIVPYGELVNVNLSYILKNYTEKDVYCVFDGSIGGDTALHGSTGFELVSHPRTLQSHKEVDWSHLFTSQTFREETCGMHVHLTRSCFTTFHLYKFMKFIYTNRKFTEGIAERKQNSYTMSIAPQEIIPNAKAGYKRKSNADRRVKVNLTSKFTIELRIFANANNEETLMKNLEFSHALFYFTQSHTKKQSLNPRLFKQYVHTNKDMYPNLSTFIVTNNL